jgi:PEP-CTERM motif
MRRKIATVLLSSLAVWIMHLAESGEARGDILLTGNSPISYALLESYKGGGPIYGYTESTETFYGNPTSTSLPFTSMTGFTGTITGSITNSITGNGTNHFTDQLNLSTTTSSSNTDPGKSNEYLTFGETPVTLDVSITTPSLVTLTLPTLNLGKATYANLIGAEAQNLYGTMEVSDGSILASLKGMTQDLNGTVSSSVLGSGYTTLTRNSMTLFLAPGNYEIDANAQAYSEFAFGAEGSITGMTTDGGSISITVTPEPTSLALLGTGFFAFAGYRLCRGRRRATTGAGAEC